MQQQSKPYGFGWTLLFMMVMFVIMTMCWVIGTSPVFHFQHFALVILVGTIFVVVRMTFNIIFFEKTISSKSQPRYPLLDVAMTMCPDMWTRFIDDQTGNPVCVNQFADVNDPNNVTLIGSDAISTTDVISSGQNMTNASGFCTSRTNAYPHTAVDKMCEYIELNAPTST